MSLSFKYVASLKNRNMIKVLSIRKKKILTNSNPHYENRGISQCICAKGLLTVEAAVVLPFFACFIVFILYFFRILHVQSGVYQALQYTGRRLAAEYSVQLSEKFSNNQKQPIEMDERFEKKEKESSHMLGLLRAKMLFEKQLKKQNCPIQYIHYGAAGIHLMQSDFSKEFVELKAVYRMKLPVAIFGNIQYRIVQEAKCRKWTGYSLGQDEEEEDAWLYYTEHGTVYHESRNCTYLDLSIRAVTYAQSGSSRNKSGGKYYSCEKCGNEASNHSMVYITDYGDRYHSSLTCSGLKRSIYMIRKSKATEKRMCSKCAS